MQRVAVCGPSYICRDSSCPAQAVRGDAGRRNSHHYPQTVSPVGPRQVVDQIPSGENLYITLDIDVLDPSQAPGTGTPAIGGLTYEELRECLEELVSRHNLVAFDLVEVAPVYDSSQITAQVASQLIIDILSARFPPA